MIANFQVRQGVGTVLTMVGVGQATVGVWTLWPALARTGLRCFIFKFLCAACAPNGSHLAMIRLESKLYPSCHAPYIQYLRPRVGVFLSTFKKKI